MNAGTGLNGNSKGEDEYASDSFDLFPNPDMENSIQHVSSIIIRPVNTYNSKGPIIFEIAPDPVKFTNLMLMLEMRWICLPTLLKTLEFQLMIESLGYLLKTIMEDPFYWLGIEHRINVTDFIDM